MATSKKKPTSKKTSSSTNTKKKTTPTKKSPTKTSNKTNSTKSTKTTKNSSVKKPPKTTQKPAQKKVENLSKTKILKTINDDELKTKIDLPVININEKQTKKTNPPLKEYDLDKKTNYFLRHIKIFILFICKVVLIFFKKVKNWIITQYNKIRRGSTSLKKKKSVEPYIEKDDELVLLHYKDYHGFAKISVFFINRVRVIKYDMKKFKKKFKYGTFKDKALIIMMLCLIAGFSLIIVFCTYVIATAPDVSEKRLYRNNASVLVDKNGNEYKRLGTENREKVTYDELPEVLIDAIIATEDSRFFQHNGVDIARFTKAVIGQLLGHSNAGGGSTLTMQVSKNAATSTTSSGIKGIIRKFTDIYLSVFVLEKKYTKEQILEFYVNIPGLGAGSYGVEQAAKIYFGKSVSELTLTEAALIAGMFQAPSAYNPYAHPEAATTRRNTVLNLMHRHGYITEEERDAAKEVPVESLLTEKQSYLSENLSFIDTVVEEVVERTKSKANPEGLDPYVVSMKIYTTMDPAKQKVVNDIMTGETYKWKNEYVQAGIAVIDVEDGSIAAVGAGRNKTTERSWNFATSARRHPGSTAKPIVDYGPAIEYLNWGTGQTIIDDKLTYSSGASIKNWDNKFKGVMTIKTALAQSRNIPALYAFQQTTNEQKQEFIGNLGWKPEDDGNGKILESCSIGGFEGVTPLESAAAFATFARGGTYIEPYSFTKIEFIESDEVFEVNPKKVQAMSEETAYLINVILKYAVTSGQIGTGSVSGTDIAAKTGTSTIDAARKKALGIKANVIGDSWEVAYSPDYAISLWYGYKETTKEHYLTSSEGGNARKAITKLLVKGIIEKNSRFKKPSGIVSAEVELGTDPLQLASDATPKELRSTEYFKKGYAPSTTSNRFAKLTGPTNIRYSSTASSVTLNWDAAPTPDAINHEYLKNYFNESKLYSKWADKYLQERIDYNNSTFGAFGYRVYVTNASGQTIDLGFTTNTSFTTNLAFDSNTKFTVKASYAKFNANMSDGVTISVAANSSSGEEPTTSTGNNTYSIEYVGPSCSTVADFNALGSRPSDKIRVMANNQNVTDSATISYSCHTSSGNDISCNNLANGTEYEILFTIKYNNSTRNKRITLKSNC